MVGSAGNLKADILLGTATFNHPAGFNETWDSVQFSVSDDGASLFNHSAFYPPGTTGVTLTVNSGAAFDLFSGNLTDGYDGAIRYIETFKNGGTGVGGLFQDSIESSQIVKTTYGNQSPGQPDFLGYSISKVTLTISGLTIDHPLSGPYAGQYVADYNTQVNVYGALLDSVPEPGQVAASLVVLLGCGGIAIRQRSMRNQVA